MPRIAFITGANGASGNALLEHLVDRTTSEEWSRIVVTSRSPLRKTYTDARVHYVQLDFQQRPGELIDLMANSCADVTHAFFASYLHTDNFGDLNKINTTLFENFLLALTSVARGLKRCVLQTDSMHYGLHLAPVPTPCREDDVRRGDPGDNFCHAQEDFLALLQTNQDWT
ncbi:Putative NAD(P)-binding domain superfamily [Septoria linicola]|uniref:NAD(P)-binding domain superfamily n=1 Tax=Septoria linicola TaxID=215465 RepID=A0A9Q9EHA5_9PEZI|nr:putative NAD(P)-binding domain superfamily [Septoria linicola]USW49113.1 Putative NAD(P)-binding domain superfamily [Septoria linicola]